MPLSRQRTRWAAYCDACLIGSFVFEYADAGIARAWAVEKLRAFGWTHVVPPDLPPAGRRLAEGAWTGETFCFECSKSARMRADACSRGRAAPP